MFNEVLRVADTARQLAVAMESLRYYNGYEYEMIFVDDGSNDGTAETLRNVAEMEQMRNVKIIAYKENHGKGRAMREAVKRTSGDIVICTDCDLAYGTDVFRTAIERMAGGDDILLGSRMLLADGYMGYSPMRRFLSKSYIRFLRLFAGFRYSDSQCGLKVYVGSVARRVFGICKSDGFAYDYETIMLADKLGYKISEMPVRIIGFTTANIGMLKEGFAMLRESIAIKRRLKRLSKRLKRKPNK